MFDVVAESFRSHIAVWQKLIFTQEAIPMKSWARNSLPILAISACLMWTAPSYAGNIFVSGHDADFHALSGNTVGAQHLIQDSLLFARNGNTAPILFLQTDTSNLALGDHLDSQQGLIASGYTAGNTAGNHYVTVNATTFSTIDLSQFSAIFVPSDHGGTLTGNDLRALDNRATDIIAYLNGGGGLVAWAEDGDHQPATPGPQPALFGFLPFLVSSTGLSQGESGFTLSPFGASLGLTVSDINNNFSHNFFTGTGGMTPVDFDAAGRIISLGFSGSISIGGVVPEPETYAMLLAGLGLLGFAARRRKLKEA
jgi:hypothetical protein